MFETTSFIHNCSNLVSDSNAKTPIIDSYDLFALRCQSKDNGGKQEMATLFDQICSKTDCDIISLNLGEPIPFFLQKTSVKLALQRGAVFELNYG